MNQKSFFLLYIAVILIVTGCATTQVTNLTPVYLKSESSVQSFKDPALEESIYKTFSVFPISLIIDKTQLGGILERQMLFLVRNIFEELGYKFVQMDQSPDFLVTIDASAPYKETYVPPQIVTVPYWVPGQTITTNVSSSGTFNFYTSGRSSLSGYGTYSGISTSTTYVPGYIAALTYTKPGYMAGAFYPSLSVSAFDGKSLRNIWTGTGVGASYNSNMRVSCQFVLRKLLKQFPTCTNTAQNYPRGNGQIGVGISIYTINGNDYSPTVMQVAEDSPASKVNVKKFDMILTINGVSTQNKPLSEIVNLLNGDAGTKLSMTLGRIGKLVDVQMVRVKNESREKMMTYNDKYPMVIESLPNYKF